MSAYVDIHEFSTGIHVERTADGGWVSTGFTGQYMNQTREVPHTVERSIRNDEFAVTEGAYSDEPAIIGRIVIDDEHKVDWSVVAIVSKGQDDSNRSASFYRYFLCEANDGIWKILSWIENYQKEQGHPPFFKPFENPKSHPWQAPDQPKPPLRPETEDLLNENSIPVIVPREHPSQLRIIHEMAERKAQETGQPVSWAVNVVALKKPQRFLIVYPASDSAYEILQSVKNVPVSSITVAADEQAIKKSIQNLIGSQAIKSEAAQIFAKALTKEQITPGHWLHWFNSQGANKMQNVRSDSANRLLALRAMVVPETLPEYLLWLFGSHNNSQRELATSLQFQNGIRVELPQRVDPQHFQQYFQARLARGIEWTLPELLAKQITPDWLAWLLLEKQSVWSTQEESFVQGVHSDLERLEGYYHFHKRQIDLNQLKYDREIWSGVQDYWQSRTDNKKFHPEYIPFAQLFETLSEYKLASYFYQVSTGKVPTAIFVEAFPQQSVRDKTQFLGLTLYRDVPLYEQSITFIRDVLVQIKIPLGIVLAITLPVVVISFMTGLAIGRGFSGETFKTWFSFNRPSPQPTNSPPSNSPVSPSSSPPVTPSTPQSKKLQPPIPSDLRNEALNRFSETKSALQQIIKDVKDPYSADKKIEDTIEEEIKNILGIPEINFSKAMNNEGPDKDRLIQAIYSYQVQHKLEAKGYILPRKGKGGGTVSRLEKQLEKQLKEILAKKGTQ